MPFCVEDSSPFSALESILCYVDNLRLANTKMFTVCLLESIQSFSVRLPAMSYITVSFWVIKIMFVTFGVSVSFSELSCDKQAWILIYADSCGSLCSEYDVRRTIFIDC